MPRPAKRPKVPNCPFCLLIISTYCPSRYCEHLERCYGRDFRAQCVYCLQSDAVFTKSQLLEHVRALHATTNGPRTAHNEQAPAASVDIPADTATNHLEGSLAIITGPTAVSRSAANSSAPLRELTGNFTGLLDYFDDIRAISDFAGRSLDDAEVHDDAYAQVVLNEYLIEDAPPVMPVATQANLQAVRQLLKAPTDPVARRELLCSTFF